MADAALQPGTILWLDLSADLREALAGKLSGLWDAATDESAFNGLTVDKQQALLLVTARLLAKGLWNVISKIDNVYGEGGVGIGFSAWPIIESTLRARSDFTQFLANHKDTSGGFFVGQSSFFRNANINQERD